MKWAATKKDTRTYLKVWRDKGCVIASGLAGLALLLLCWFKSITYGGSADGIASYDPVHVCRKNSNVTNTAVLSTAGVLVAEHVFLFVDKPSKSFHSDHWFHLGEYFVGWRAQIRQQIDQHCGKYQGDSSNKQANCLQAKSFKLVIVADRVSFVNHFTKMTLFLLLLSVSNEGTTFSQVSVYGPITHRERCLRTNGVVHDGHSDCYSLGKRVVVYSKDADNGKYTYRFQHDNLDDSVAADYLVYNPRHANSGACMPGVGVVNLKIGRDAKSSFLWFDKGGNDTAGLRGTLASLCAGAAHYGIEEEVKFLYYSVQNTEERTVVMYDRDSNRRIAQLGAVVQHLTRLLLSATLAYNVRLKVLVHDEANDPCDVYRLLNTADLFLTSHGFQSTGILFLRPGASLLEIFPYNYRKDSYRNLSGSLDVKYHSLQNTKVTSYNRMNLYLVSQERCMDSHKCRRYARGDHVHLTQRDLAEIVGVILRL